MPAQTTARNWATILYPESCHPDFLEIISEFHVPAFLSPLHDHDYDKYGECKKAHYHLMLMYEYRKSAAQFARDVVEPLLGVGTEIVHSRCGYARYLCHLDNQDKYQYDVSEVTSFSGADYSIVIHSSASELQAVAEIVSWIHSHPKETYSQLVDYALDEKPEWFQVLMSYKSNFILNYYRNRPMEYNKWDGWRYLPDSRNDVFPPEAPEKRWKQLDLDY